MLSVNRNTDSSFQTALCCNFLEPSVIKSHITAVVYAEISANKRNIILSNYSAIFKIIT